ncbi:SAM-dependent methyltransferase [Lysobacter claricitrinus]|uniref:SAM-dependent methyltransferase n=1 Tax=Lysobacter claricitrinus TaxID=3367728 RepID=UPI0037DA87F3
MAAKPGRLTCVGVGMMLGAHLTPRARHEIECSDVVFAAVSDAVVELWLQGLRPDLRSLQPLYAADKSRLQTYRDMVQVMMGEVRVGKSVCGVFYGHPGVFAHAPHDAILRARNEGFEASMEAAISAEDCMYADMGIDPGRVGCQHYEATQILLYRRRLDPSAYLVLWQVGVVGDRSYRRSSTTEGHRKLLVERLLEDYPATHPVTVYEAATLPIAAPRIETIELSALVDTELRAHSTLVIPPATELVADEGMRQRLSALDKDTGMGLRG